MANTPEKKQYEKTCGTHILLKHFRNCFAQIIPNFMQEEIGGIIGAGLGDYTH
jgi:hypothetical protein